VNGDESKVEQFYQAYQSQLMFNPWWSRTATVKHNRPLPKQSSILSRSKTIKKRNKGSKVVAAEEGEEVVDHSGADSNQDEQMEDERAPTALLGQYDKFPLFIDFTLKPLPSIFSSSLLQSFNRYALNEVLDQK